MFIRNSRPGEMRRVLVALLGGELPLIIRNE